MRQMWNVYTHSRHIQLPVFWQKAFAASYDQMVSEDLEMSDAAVLEIAKMSMRVVELKPPTTEEDEVRFFILFVSAENRNLEGIRLSVSTSDY